MLKYILLGFFIAFFLLINYSEACLAQGMSLLELIERTMLNNKEIRVAQSELKIAESLVKQAEGFRNFRSDVFLKVDYQKTPTSLQSLYEFVNEDIADNYIVVVGTVALSKSLFPSIKNDANLKQAEKMYEEAKNKLRVVELQVLKKLLEGVYKLFQAKDSYILAEKVVNLEETELIRKKDEYQKGVISKKDLMLGEKSFKEAEINLSLALEYLQLALENIRQISGISYLRSDDLISPSWNLELIPAQVLPFPWNLAQLQKMAKENNPELVRISLGQEVAQIQLEEVKAERLPSYSLQGNFSFPEQKMELALKFDSDYRFISTLSRYDTTLTELDLDISDSDWDNFLDPWKDNLPPWFPDRDAFSNYFSLDFEQEKEWKLTFELAYNIFDSNLTNQRIREKEEQKAKLNILYEQMEEGMNLLVYSRYLDLKDAYTSLRIAKLEYDLSKRGFEDIEKMGEKDVLSFNDLEKSQLEVKVKKNNFKKSYYDYELAKVNLGLVLGLNIDNILAMLILR